MEYSFGFRYMGLEVRHPRPLSNAEPHHFRLLLKLLRLEWGKQKVERSSLGITVREGRCALGWDRGDMVRGADGGFQGQSGEQAQMLQETNLHQMRQCHWHHLQNENMFYGCTGGCGGRKGMRSVVTRPGLVPSSAFYPICDLGQ